MNLLNIKEVSALRRKTEKEIQYVNVRLHDCVVEDRATTMKYHSALYSLECALRSLESVILDVDNYKGSIG